MAPDNRDTEERIEIDVGHNALKMIWASVFLFAVSVPAVMAVSAAAPWIRGKMLAILWSVPAIFALLAVVGVAILYSVPIYIGMDREKITLGYALPVSEHSRQILWKDISEIEDYGLLTTAHGEMVALGQLGADKEQISRIRRRFYEATGRREDKEDDPHLRRLAGPRAKKECRESLEIGRRDPISAIALVGMGAIPAAGLAWAFYSGYAGESMDPSLRYLFSGFFLLISFMTLVMGNIRLKKRTIRMGPMGVEYAQGRKTIFRYSWGELKLIKLYMSQGRYPRPYLMFQGLFEDKWEAGRVDSNDYRADEFERLVRLAARYALCEGVRFEDHIGWPKNYDSSFKELLEMGSGPAPEELAGSAPPVPKEIK